MLTQRVAAGGGRGIFYTPWLSAVLQFQGAILLNSRQQVTEPIYTHRACSVGIFKFDFEEQDLDEDTVWRLVWREVMYYQQS